MSPSLRTVLQEQAGPRGRANGRAGLATRMAGARVAFGGRALVLLVCAGVLSSGRVGDVGGRIGSGVLVALAVFNAAFWVGLSRRPWAVYAIPTGDLIGVFALTIVDRQLWAPAAVYGTAALCQAATFVGRQALLRVNVIWWASVASLTLWVGWAEALPTAVGVGIVSITTVPLIYAVVQANRSERHRLNYLLDEVEAVVWEFDRVTRQFSYVSGHAETFGLSPEAWVATPEAWLELVHPDDRPQVSVDALIDRAERGLSVEIRAGRPPMYDRVFRLATSVVTGRHPSERRVRGVMVDISDLRKSESLIRHQARHDSLTGLANRAAVVTQVANELASGSPRVALLLLDLDKFKEVNDALGHHRGDFLLQEVGRRLERCLPSDCFVGRLGGDEFAVVVPLTNRHNDVATECADRVVEALCEPVLSDGLTMQIGVSIGIAFAPDHAHDQDSLFRRADMTMYVAKRSGGGWAVWQPDYEEETARNFHLATALREAIDLGRITVEYQPRISIASNRVVGFEGLARWHDPKLGYVGPSEFVAAAQVAGISLKLVTVVVRTAAADLRRLRAVDPGLKVAVNVTTTDLVMTGFEEMLFSELEAAGAPPEAFVLELSEGEAIQNAKLLNQVLTRLAERGVRLSIDDFGQGYSSMDRMRSLPLHEIKIDRTFVSRMRQDPIDRAIVESIVRLGHHLALEVVAEGVEDAEVLADLKVLRCDAFQGRLAYDAMPIEKAESLVRWQQPDPRMRPVQGPSGNVPGLLGPRA